MSGVKVSVVVPVYNPGRYIHECVASILSQSLPKDEYEAIFVDDGSTDGTGEWLDALALEHANLHSIRIPNSGWPGRPRNVGIDAAKGKYIYFVDNDDWIAEEVLERLYNRAEKNGADVVVGKIVGHGKGKYVPRHQFRRNVDSATLDDPGADPPLLGLLSPHKLYRKALLDEHHIRFPEGRRRLEDHVFVMKAFFKAQRMSILADYPCYHWMRREDASNASFARADTVVYYRAVRDVLDVIDENTDPGPRRDRLYLHWYRANLLQRMTGPAWAAGEDPHVRATYAAIRELALERFGPGVARLLECRWRLLSRSLQADRFDLVSAQAASEHRFTMELKLDSAEWTESSWRLAVSATLMYADGTPLTFVARGERLFWQPPEPLAGDQAEDDQAILDATSEVEATTMSLVLHDRESFVEYDIPAKLQAVTAQTPDGTITISPRGEIDIELATVAAGFPLPAGVWDLFLEVRSCGWSSVRRLSQVGGPRERGGRRVEPHTTQFGNLSLKVSDFEVGSRPPPLQPALPQPALPQPAPPPPRRRGRSARIKAVARRLARRVLPAAVARRLRRLF